MNTLDVENLNSFSNIENFYSELDRHIRDTNSPSLTLNLAEVKFLTPEAVLAILCSARYWYLKKGTPTRVIAQDDLVGYLDRMDLINKCREFFKLEKPISNLRKRGFSANLLEITPVSSDPDQNSLIVYDVYQRTQAILLGRIEPKRMDAVVQLLSEIMQNIIHSEDMGHVMMQAYEGNRAHIGIVDLGIGISNSLRTKYPDIGNGSDYIKHALGERITSRDGAGGLGLYHVEQIIKNGKGSLTIRSGSSILQILEGREYKHDNLTYIPGTQVFITVGGKHENAQWKYLLSDR